MNKTKKIIFSSLFLTTFISASPIYFYKTDLFLTNDTNESNPSNPSNPITTPEGGVGEAVPDCVPLINGVTAIGTRSDNFCGHEGEDLVFVAVNSLNVMMLKEAIQPNLNGEWANLNAAISATSITHGYQNTTTISNAYTSSAALTCRNKGISWYLPARNEFQSIVQNQNQVDIELRLPRTTYWTSTAVSGDNNRAVLAEYFSSGLNFINDLKRWNSNKILCIKDGNRNNPLIEDISATISNGEFEVTRNNSFSARLFENINFENVYGNYTTTWSLSGDVPTWATFNENTTILSGTPTELNHLGLWEFNIVANITDEIRTAVITIPVTIDVLNSGCIESSDIPSLRSGVFEICGYNVPEGEYLAVIDGNLFHLNRVIKREAYNCGNSFATHSQAEKISNLLKIPVYTPQGGFIPPFPTTFSSTRMMDVSAANTTVLHVRGIAPTVGGSNPNGAYMYFGTTSCSSSSTAPNYVFNCGAYVIPMVVQSSLSILPVCRYNGCASEGPLISGVIRTYAMPTNLDQSLFGHRACRIDL